LITDTLGFRTSNMTSHALRLAADLMDHGLDLPDLYRRVLLTRSFEATRMWGVGLGQIERKHGVAWTSLSQTDRTTAGYAGKDDADLINILAAIDDIDIAVVFVEQSGKPTEAYPEGHVKVSWRAQPGWDVSQLAVAFGGGGHPAASGADIPGGLDEVRQAVLTATFATLKNQRAARATTTPHEPTSPAGANGDQWTVTTT
jgi:phosphoesterase RecJ-like protein